MIRSKNFVPVLGTALLVSVTVLAILGMAKGAQATPPMQVGGLVVLALSGLAGIAGLLGIWLPRMRQAP